LHDGVVGAELLAMLFETFASSFEGVGKTVVILNVISVAGFGTDDALRVRIIFAIPVGVADSLVPRFSLSHSATKI